MDEIKERWFQTSMTLEEAESFIQENMVTAVKSYVATGYYLRRIRDDKLYQQSGYENFENYVESKYGRDKGWASKCIRVNQELSIDGNTPNLDKRYLEYSTYQLVELSYLDDGQRERTTPDMTVKQMREVRKPEKVVTSQLSEEQNLVDESQPTADLQQIPDEEDAEDIIDGDFTEIGNQWEEPEEDYTIWDIRDEIANLKEKLNLVEKDEEFKETKAYRKLKMQYDAVLLLEEKYGEPWMNADAKEPEAETEQPVVEQPELPLLKNNDQRKEWLKNHRDWGLWYEDSHIGVKYYKYDFMDGTRLITEEYPSVFSDYMSHFHMVGGSKERPRNTSGCDKYPYHENYSRYPDSESEVVEFLKEIQKK